MSLAKRFFFAIILLGLGWAVGYAQRPNQEFMLSIDAPAGETRIECVSGCGLRGSRDLRGTKRGTNENVHLLLLWA